MIYNAIVTINFIVVVVEDVMLSLNPFGSGVLKGSFLCLSRHKKSVLLVDCTSKTDSKILEFYCSNSKILEFLLSQLL